MYAVAWSPDSESILYVDGEYLKVKPKQAGSKHTQVLNSHASYVLKISNVIKEH